MCRETLAAVIHWQNTLDAGDEPIEITFHGGEPLVPGADFWRCNSCAMSWLLEVFALACRATCGC